MRILFFGDGAWAEKSLDRLLREGRDISGVVVRTRPTDQALLNIAKSMGIPLYQPKEVNSPEFIDQVKEIEPDLNISVSYDQILRRPIIETAPSGFINFHAGKLPFYRGRNVINWAIINNEKEIGITGHYMDEGIDTGDIIIQRTVPIEWTDTYGIMLNKVVNEIPELVYEAVKLISEGNCQAKSQKGLHGTYFAKREAGDEWLNWEESSVNIYNKIRAISRPGPGALTVLESDPIIIWEAFYEMDWPGYIANCGQVVGINNDGVFVKTGDSTILIKEIQIGDKIPEKPSWPIGTRLGLNKNDEIIKLRKEINRLTNIIEQNNLTL